MERRLHSILTHQTHSGYAFWFMRQAGRYLPEYRKVREKSKNFLKLCYTPELATEVTLQPIERFQMDAAILFSDILVIPHALGMELSFEEGHGPKLAKLENAQCIQELSEKNLLSFLNPVYEAVKMIRSSLPYDKSLIGFSGSPWTLACYMVEGGSSSDFARARLWAMRDPISFAQLIRLLETSVVEHLCAQIEAGVDVVQLFDSWAGVLSEPEFMRWVVEPTARIVAALKKRYPTIPVIGFPRMAGANLAAYARISGLDGVSLDTATPLSWARTQLPKNIIPQGNLDPMALVAGGKIMLDEMHRICDIFQDKAFVFNLGHGIVPHTPVEHMNELCNALHERRRMAEE